MTQHPPSFLVDVADGHILLTPVSEEGYKQRTQRLSIETAAHLQEALRQAILAAKIRFWA